MFWKNIASGCRSLPVLKFSSYWSKVLNLLANSFTKIIVNKNISIDGEWPVLTVRVDWAQLTFLKQQAVTFWKRALRVKVRLLSAMPNSNPVELGYDLPPGIFSFSFGLNYTSKMDHENPSFNPTPSISEIYLSQTIAGDWDQTVETSWANPS